MTVKGQNQIQKKLSRLRKRIADKAAASGIRAGLAEYRQSMRQAVSKPSVRKVIASRFKRRRKQGQTVAKVGAGVGKQKTTASVRSRPGVGISKKNAHWYFAGTGPRRTRSGANRGRMPKSTAVRRGAMRARMSAVRKAHQKMREVIEKEARKAA